MGDGGRNLWSHMEDWGCDSCIEDEVLTEGTPKGMGW